MFFAENPRRKMFQPLDPEEIGMFCPECGMECEIRRVTSGLDYDWCNVCDHEVFRSADDWDSPGFFKPEYGDETGSDWNV